jgi:hypothetical protein
MLRTIAQIAVAFAPVILAGAIPFIRITRGGRVTSAFFICWGLLIFWVAFFSLGLPIIASGFSRELTHTVSRWVPEGPAVIAMVFFGWFYAGITVLLSVMVVRFRRKQG